LGDLGGLEEGFSREYFPGIIRECGLGLIRVRENNSEEGFRRNFLIKGMGFFFSSFPLSFIGDFREEGLF